VCQTGDRRGDFHRIPVGDLEKEGNVQPDERKCISEKKRGKQMRVTMPRQDRRRGGLEQDRDRRERRGRAITTTHEDLGPSTQ